MVLVEILLGRIRDQRKLLQLTVLQIRIVIQYFQSRTEMISIGRNNSNIIVLQAGLGKRYERKNSHFLPVITRHMIGLEGPTGKHSRGSPQSTLPEPIESMYSRESSN